MNAISVVLVSGWVKSGKTLLAEALCRDSIAKAAHAIDIGQEDPVALVLKRADEALAARIFLELDPILEPLPVAEVFCLPSPDGEPPDPRVTIAGSITVVDAVQFLPELERASELASLGLAFEEADERTVADVLLEQIEFATVVVLRRISELEPTVANRIDSLVSWLNPAAAIIHCGIEGPRTEEVERALEVGGFDFFAVEEAAGWLQLIDGVHRRPSTSAGVSGFSLRARRPLHPERFQEFLRELENLGVVRAKGWIWIATRHHEAGLWCFAAKSSVLLSTGAWLAATPMRDWPADPADREEVMKLWVPPWGDRRTEVGFIGTDLDELDLRRRFKACLLSDAELGLGPEAWMRWHDPLPPWLMAEDAEAPPVLMH